MASSITLKVGTVESVITFSRTDAEIAAVLLRFIRNWADPEPEGLTVAQRNKWRLDQAAAKVVSLIRQEAMQVRLKELHNDATFEEQAEQDSRV